MGEDRLGDGQERRSGFGGRGDGGGHGGEAPARTWSHVADRHQLGGALASGGGATPREADRQGRGHG